MVEVSPCKRGMAVRFDLWAPYMPYLYKGSTSALQADGVGSNPSYGSKLKIKTFYKILLDTWKYIVIMKEQ